MERNERAILKVLEDQRRRSNVETTARRAEWTRKLDELSTKASKEQRILSENLEQLKIENNQLKAALNITKDRVKVSRAMSEGMEKQS
jgi:organic radical activating enzyme